MNKKVKQKLMMEEDCKTRKRVNNVISHSLIQKIKQFLYFILKLC